MPDPLLKLENIHKSFGPVKALKGVDLEIYPGRVHGLIGENGAGKSTLMKVLSGVYQPDEGRMILRDRPYAPLTPLDGRDAGISMIYQELNLAPHLTVEENITLGIEQARLGWIKPQSTRVREVLDELGQEAINPKTRLGDLSIGKQQLVEIARALLSEARVVVMDEPTSSLSAEDTSALFQVIHRLKEKGVAVIYISHFLEEVKEVCDTFTVLRDGETVAHGTVAESTIPELIEYMVGRSVTELYPQADHALGEKVLEVSALKGVKNAPSSASFHLRKGEILGLFGLVGSGRSETLRTVFGLREAEDGTITLSGHPALQATWISPPRALHRGLDMLSEDRKEEGLALNLSILANLTLSALHRYSRYGILNLRNEARAGKRWSETLQVKLHSLSQPIDNLSGGNQQKVCLARLLHHDSDILFLDEPTRGIDIGSKAEIYRLIHQLAAQQKAIVVVSSYLPEILGICDSLMVMHKGRLSAIRPVSEWTEQDIMHFATSGR